MKYKHDNPNVIPVEPEMTVPFESEHGWFYFKGEPNTRIEGSARVSGDARVFDNARVSGDAWVSGNAWVSGDARVYDNARVSGDARVCGGTLVGRAITFTATRWNASFVKPGVCAVGCKEHPVEEWIKDGESAVPWAEHCTADEKRVIQGMIRAAHEMEKLGLTWAKEEV